MPEINSTLISRPVIKTTASKNSLMKKKVKSYLLYTLRIFIGIGRGSYFGFSVLELFFWHLFWKARQPVWLHYNRLVCFILDW